MANEKKPDVKVTKLPSMEHTFSISIVGSETGEVKDGTFTYKRLTLGKRMESAKMEARLREDLKSLPMDVNLYSEMISFLRFGLIVYPEWWKNSNFGIDLYDVNIVTGLWNEVQKFESEWEKQVKG
ncbi:hypothetical protein CCP1ISM_330006 [Azospirillaceae bacterium]